MSTMDKLAEQLDQLRIEAERTKSAADEASQRELCQTYAKAVCDCTFFHENYLSEREFRDKSAERDLRQMIDLLSAIGTLCLTIDRDRDQLIQAVDKQQQDVSSLVNLSDKNRALINVLGIEFAEVVPWRKGSLLYAFCASKINSDDVDWLNTNQAQLLNYLHEGINYLQEMLSLRKPLSSGGDSAGPDKIAVGAINSDTIASFIDQLSEEKLEEERKSILHRKLMLGEEGQELEQLEEVLEAQQEANHEALLDIQQQMHLNQQPHLEDVLQEVQMEVQQQQQEVLDRQEEQEEMKKQLHEKFLQLQLQQQHLESMMHQVSERMKAQEATGEPDSTTQLISMGIYSDSSLLAIMYSAEMAYWYCSYSQQWQLFDPCDKEQNSTWRELSDLGKSMLNLYIKAVTKCGLDKVGWSCDRAKELRTWFRKNGKKR